MLMNDQIEENKSYDVVIVGAGPAGSVLAKLIGNTCKVLLLEKRDFDQPLYSGLQKCCGGLLDSSAQNMLAKLGLALPQEVLCGPQPFGIKAIDLNSGQARNFQRNYINIDREAFDKWLCSLVPDSVNIRCNAWYQKHEEIDDTIKVRYTENGQSFEVMTKVLVGADGAMSAVRRKLGMKAPPRKYFSIQEWFKDAAPLNEYGAFFDNRISDFYSWTIPKNDALVVGATFPARKNCLERFELFKNELRKHGYKIDAEKSFRKNGAFILRPRSFFQTNAGKGNVALIGEAGGFISPSSAEGISFAMKTACALADSLINHFPHWQNYYRRKLWKVRLLIILKNMKAPLMYHPIFRRPIFALGLTSIKIITQRCGSSNHEELGTHAKTLRR
jgi:flavin-dependent dehydrogenase